VCVCVTAMSTILTHHELSELHAKYTGSGSYTSADNSTHF